MKYQHFVTKNSNEPNDSFAIAYSNFGDEIIINNTLLKCNDISRFNIFSDHPNACFIVVSTLFFSLFCFCVTSKSGCFQNETIGVSSYVFLP